ncbi:MAG: DMT family transporter [Acidaminobacteraceae bacterium]
MKSKVTPYIALFIGVFALSTSAIFVRLADAPSAIVAFYRLFFTAIMLMPFLIFNKSAKSELKSLSKKDWLIGALSGVFLSMHYVLWFESLKYTSVASSIVIVTLQPLFSIVGGFFIFKERIAKKAIFGSFIAIVGSMIIGWGDFQISNEALFGDLLAFIAAGIITAYFFTGQHLRKNLSVISYSLIGYVSSSIFLAIYAYVQGASFTNYPLKTWQLFIGLAFVATILGQFTFNWLLKWLSTTVISMSIMGETIGAVLLSYFILNESITIKQAFGIMFILVGIGIFLYNNRNVEDKSIEASVG